METLKEFDLELVRDNGYREYSLKEYGIRIVETKSLNGEFYQLSTKEVLNVLEFFKALKELKIIKINNNKLLNLQAYVSPLTSKTLSLNAVSELTEGRYGVKGERKNALFTLIHEIAHIKGEYNETKADKFASENIDKVWGKLIKE